MRRLRILLNTATVLSLLLCAATLWVGAWSFRRPVEVTYIRRAADTIERCRVVVQRGVVWVDNAPEIAAVAVVAGQLRARRARSLEKVRSIEVRLLLAPGDDRVEAALRAEIDAWNRDRYALRRAEAALRTGAWSWAAPSPVLPALAVAFAVAPGLAWGRRRRVRNRRRAGLCLACGYDLRATPQGGRCPECGQVPSGR